MNVAETTFFYPHFEVVLRGFKFLRTVRVVVNVCLPVILANAWPLICATRLFYTWYPVGVRIFFRALRRLHACRGRKFRNRPSNPSRNECDYCLRQYEVLQNLHIFLKWRHSRTFGHKIAGLRETLKTAQTDNSLVELLNSK